MSQLDPNIILQAGRGVTPLEQPSEVMGKALQLRQMLNQGQQASMQMQQMRQQMQDAQELRDTIKNASSTGQDPLQAVSKLGSPIALQTAQHMTDMRTKGVELNQKQYDLMTKQAAGLAQDVATTAAAPGATKQAVQDHLTQLAQQGKLPPDKYQELIQSVPDDPKALPSWGQLQLTKAQGVAPEVLKLFTPKTDVHGNMAVTQNPMTGEVTKSAPVPGMPASEPAKELQDYNASSGKPPVGLNDPGFIAWHNKMHPNMATVINGIGGGQGKAPGAPLQDAGMEAAAQAIARGDSPMQDYSIRNPYAKSINARAAEINPALLGKSEVAARASGLKDFEGSGKANVTIRALNTMTEHVATARRMAQALDNGDIPMFNKLSQGLAKATGQPAITNLETLKEFLAGEVATVAQGGHITEGGINKAAESIRTAGSPKQLLGGLDTMDEVAAGKLVALNQDYSSLTHGAKSLDSKLTPATLRVFKEVQKRQGQGSQENKDASGLTHLHSNGTQTIGWDGSKWVDTKTMQEVK